MASEGSEFKSADSSRRSSSRPWSSQNKKKRISKFTTKVKKPESKAKKTINLYRGLDE